MANCGSRVYEYNAEGSVSTSLRVYARAVPTRYPSACLDLLSCEPVAFSSVPLSGTGLSEEVELVSARAGLRGGAIPTSPEAFGCVLVVAGVPSAASAPWAR